MTFLKKRFLILATLCLMLLAFSLAAWSSDSIFDRLPRTEDEVTFLFQARTIREGHIIAPGPEHGEFFFMSFVIVQDGQWFGKYPPGYPLILAAGVFLGQPWVVNAAAAAVAVGLLVMVGRRFYDSRTALVAGVLMAMSPFFIIQSGSLLSHVVALCWALALYLLFDMMRTSDSPFIAVSVGAVGGMLLLTRPLTAIGIALPFIAVAGFDLVSRRSLWKRYALAAAGFTPFVAALLMYNDATAGSPFRSAYELWWSYDRIGFGPEYGINGHSLEDALDNTQSNLRALGVVLFGWPGRLSFVPIVLAAVVACCRARQGRWTRSTSADLMLAGMILGLIGVHMLYWTSGKMYGPRYYFEIIGAMSLLGARGIIWTWDEIGSRVRRLTGHVRRVQCAAALCLVALAAYSLFVTLPEQSERYRGWNGVQRNDLEAVEAAGLDNALVFIPRPNWQFYAPFFLENSTTLDGPVIYAVDRGDSRNSVLMRDYPERRFYRYQEGELTPL